MSLSKQFQLDLIWSNFRSPFIYTDDKQFFAVGDCYVIFSD